MRTRLTAAALTAAALLALTACSSSDSNDKAATPSATPSVDVSSIAAAAGIPAAPNAADRAAFLAAIQSVDPTLAKHPDTAVDRGRNQCSSLNGGAANVDHLAAERFGNDAHPLTDADGKLINVALRATLCPKS